MLSFDLFIPWIVFGATLFALTSVQRWIHRHVFGMGFLIAQDKRLATLIYYLALLPGIVLHELSRYFIAGMFHIAPTYFLFFPRAQDDGSLEMGFVQFTAVRNPVFAAMIGIAPLVTGLICLVLVGNTLEIPQLINSLGSADLLVIGPALERVLTKPDFLLWFWVLFSVANAMMPRAEERLGWAFLAGLSGLFFLFLVVIGMFSAIVYLLSKPIATALYSLSAVFGTALFLDIVALVIIWITEGVLERVTNRKVEYRPALPAARPAGAGPMSVYDLRLPLPLPPAPGQSRTPKLGAGLPGARPAPKPVLAATSGAPSETAARPIPARPEIPAPSKPAAATPLSTPAAPAASTGAGQAATPPKPGTAPLGPPPLGKPVTPGAKPEPAKPGTAPLGPPPFSKPGTPAAPAASAGATPGGAPPKPGTAPLPPLGKPATPGAKPGTAPLGPPPATPKSPFAPAASGERPERPGLPAPGQTGRPATPGISGPPALARPSAAAEPNKAGLPKTTPPPFSAASRPPSGPAKDEDIIDAELIDEEDDDGDKDDIKYVDLDEA